jgi:hypothetical protein
MAEKKDHIDSFLTLRDSEKLDSKELEEQFMITFRNDNDNIFKIIADNCEFQFVSEFKMSDYVNMKEKDFTSKINNFNLLLETIQKALDNNKVIVTRVSDTLLKMTFHYSMIYDEKTISFELPKKKSEEEEKEAPKEEAKEEVEEDNKNEVDFKAEVIEYNKKFEDFGDRNIIRVLIENKGSYPWPKEKTSFRCSQEFSSLICKEYFLEDEVSPGEQIELALEFLKNQKDDIQPPYMTSILLHIHPLDYDPMIVLDFNESYSPENIPFVGPEVVKPIEKEESKTISINDVNITDETKESAPERSSGRIEIKKKGKTVIKKKVKTLVVDTDSGPKEMTPFQRRIYELNQREKERVEKEKEKQKKTGWKKNF